jgi:dATP/dGTP diphosphohydrolase, N-terminal
MTTTPSTLSTSSAVDPANPKDLLGVKKISITKLPPVAVLHTAHALMDGAVKYGPYNWRDKAVVASIYVDACQRHLDAWFDGEEEAADSGVHHLGHAMACLAILLDAQETGNLIDDRPAAGRGTFARVLERLNQKIKTQANSRVLRG